MARPDPWRLDPASYPYSVNVQTRFGDMDILGHINNVSIAALFENGRVRFNRSFGFMRVAGERWLMANVSTAYVAEAHFPQDVSIATGILAIGNRSWTMASAAFQDARCVATSDAVLVYTLDGESKPLPQRMIDAFHTCRITEGVNP